MCDIVFRTVGETFPLGVIEGIPHVLVVEEVADGKKHYHGYVSNWNIVHMRNRLQKYFKGNKQYSCKLVKDPERQKRYLLKGDKEGDPPVVVHNSLIEPSQVPLEHSTYWAEMRVAKEVKKEKRSKGTGLKELLVQRVLKLRDERDRQDGCTYLSIEDIVTQCMILCSEEGKVPPDKFLMARYVEYVRCVVWHRSGEKGEYESGVFRDMVHDKIKMVIDALTPRLSGFN